MPRHLLLTLKAAATSAGRKTPKSRWWNSGIINAQVAVRIIHYSKRCRRATQRRSKPFRRISLMVSRSISCSAWNLSSGTSKLISTNETAADADRAPGVHRNDRCSLYFHKEKLRPHSLSHHARLHGRAHEQIFRSRGRSAIVVWIGVLRDGFQSGGLHNIRGTGAPRQPCKIGCECNFLSFGRGTDYLGVARGNPGFHSESILRVLLAFSGVSTQHFSAVASSGPAYTP